MNSKKLLCLTEPNLDTIEIALRKEYNTKLAAGNIENAEYLESIINTLENFPICD